MMEIRLLIRSPDIWVRDLMMSNPGNLKFLDCMPWGPKGGRGLLSIEGSKEHIQDTVRSIKTHRDIERVETSMLKDGGAILTVTTRRCHACRALYASDCFLLSSTSTAEGDLIWTIIAPNDGAVTTLVDSLEAKGTVVKFLSITPIDHERVLTTRQMDIIRLAFEQGYYELPKKTSIKKLARRFKIAPSSLAETLQRGERKIIGLFFKANR